MRNIRHSSAAPLAYLSMLAFAFSVVGPSSHQQLPIDDIARASSGTNASFFEITRKFLLEGGTEAVTRTANSLIKSMPYIQAYLPSGASECIQQSGLLRCTKLLALQQMEHQQQFPHTANLTRAFPKPFSSEQAQTDNLISIKYADMSDKELNWRLAKHFQRYLKNQDIKLQILPHTIVQIVASRDDKFKFSIKKNSLKSQNDFSGRAVKNEEVYPDVGGSIDDFQPAAAGIVKKLADNNGGIIQKQKQKKKKHSYKSTILQMAVPVMVLPAILMSSFLPFVLPVLKVATIMTMLMNNSAFLAALIYAARTHANSQEEQHISYGHTAYH